MDWRNFEIIAFTRAAAVCIVWRTGIISSRREQNQSNAQYYRECVTNCKTYTKNPKYVSKPTEIKYYDPKTGLEVAESDRVEGVQYKEVTTIETTPKYYTVSLKQTQYGDPNGTTTMTFGWEKNADTGKLEFKQDPTTPVGQTITYKYNAGGGSLERIENKTAYETITGAFVGQTTDSSSSTQYGGAIYNGNSGTIGNITADFIGNHVSGSSYSRGGAIYNEGTIDNITGNFIGNYAQSNGGAIYNDGKIGNITGNFIGNYVHSKDKYALGGAIYQTVRNVTATAKLGLINNNFINNYAISENGVAKGGAIFTRSDLTISADNGIALISGNYTESNGVRENNAIYVSNIADEDGVVEHYTTLTLNAVNNGKIQIDDTITGGRNGISFSFGLRWKIGKD